MVSIIIPVYNRAKTLQRCVDSVLKQTYTDIEIILVDDDSADSSDVLCDDFASKDPRVKALHVQADGVALTRNEGIDVAKGEYITFIDSDDYVAPNYIEKLVSAIEEEGCVCAMCNSFDVNGESKKECIFPGNGKREVKSFLEDSMYCRANGGTCWGKIYRREDIKIKFRDYNYNEDLFFVFDYLSALEGYVNMVPDCLYYYCPCENSITVIKKSSDLIDVIDVCSAIRDICKDKYPDILDYADALLINNAFFAYLSSKKDKGSEGDELRNKAAAVIKEYRGKTIKDSRATLKTKMACHISYVSLKLLMLIYGMIK